MSVMILSGHRCVMAWTDAIFAPVYYRLLLRFAPLTEAYGNQLIDQAFLRVRPRKRASMIA
jgi:hypothetical protein